MSAVLRRGDADVLAVVIDRDGEDELSLGFDGVGGDGDGSELVIAVGEVGGVESPFLSRFDGGAEYAIDEELEMGDVKAGCLTDGLEGEGAFEGGVGRDVQGDLDGLRQGQQRGSPMMRSW